MFELEISAIMLDLLDETILTYTFPSGSLSKNQEELVHQIADQHGIVYYKNIGVLKKDSLSISDKQK